MSAEEAPIENPPAIARNIGIAVTIAVVVVVAIIVVMLVLTPGTFTPTTTGG
jgi:hypothetical protein